jgi:tetratricopeptide (TPR) repeat protein
VTVLQRAVEVSPADPVAKFEHGRALSAVCRCSDAVAEFRAAVAMDANLAEAHVELGRALIELGRPAEALEALERGHELGQARGADWRYPTAEWIEQAHAHIALAERLARWRAGDRDLDFQIHAVVLGAVARRAGLFRSAGELFRIGVPALFDEPQDHRTGNLHEAILVAAALATRPEVEGAAVTSAEHEEWSLQGVEWLEAWWEDCSSSVDFESPVEQLAAVGLTSWRFEPDLRAFRDALRARAADDDLRSRFEVVDESVADLFALRAR